MTAQDFYNDDETPLENMIGFARHQVTLALEAVHEKMKADGLANKADKQFIMDMYPLSNIK